MGQWFSSKKTNENKGQPKSKITEQDRAQLIYILIEKEKAQVKILLKDGEKTKALMILRKKKYQEKLLESTIGQIENLEHMISQIETAEIETKVLEGLRHGNEALKALQKELSIEDVEAVMEDARELQQWASDISDVAGMRIEDLDDETLYAEFADEFEEKLGSATAAADELPELPTVPNDNLPDLPAVPTDELPDLPSEPNDTDKHKQQEKEAELVPA
eukprot:gene6611-9421_t